MNTPNRPTPASGGAAPLNLTTMLPPTRRPLLRREHYRMAADTDRAMLAEQTRALFTSQVLSHTAALMTQMEAQVKSAPAGTGYYAQIVAAYANGAARRVADL